MVDQCNAITRSGKACKGRPLPGKPYCISHDPSLADQRAEGQRKGGEARANARRAAKQWAAIGEQVGTSDIPAILRACMVAVKAGEMEPGQANAIANLAKTSVSVGNEMELGERIRRLEEVAGVTTNVRRLA